MLKSAWRGNFSSSKILSMSCLVMYSNHPRAIRRLVASWTSLYSTFFCLSSSSIGFQTVFRSILRCCQSIAFLVFVFFAPGVVPCMISFSRQYHSFLITCSKYDKFPSFDHGENSSSHSRRLQYTFVCLLLCPRHPQNSSRAFHLKSYIILCSSGFLRFNFHTHMHM